MQAHTVVLKRQYDVELPEYGKEVVLKDCHNIYYIDTVVNGPKELKVILTEDSDGMFGYLAAHCAFKLFNFKFLK